MIQTKTKMELQSSGMMGFIKALPNGLTLDVEAGRCFKRIGMLDPKSQFVNEDKKDATAIVDAIFGMTQ